LKSTVIPSNILKNRAVVFFIVCGFLLENGTEQTAYASEELIYPVVNQNSPQKNISRNGISAIFKMRLRHWQDGSAITVFVLQDDDFLHKLFCKQVLNVFPHQMRRGWNKLVFSGTGQAPVQVKDKQEMIERLNSTPGGVGYLVEDDIRDSIRILEIQ
jgi:hypothetical protein